MDERKHGPKPRGPVHPITPPADPGVTDPGPPGDAPPERAGVPTVELTGQATLGHIFARANQLITRTAAHHPTKVKLGRKPPIPNKQVARFADHFHPPSGWKPPDGADWSAKAAKSLLTMLGNDQAGDCVIAGKGHAVGVWTANDSDSGGEVVATTDECLREYRTICGPGDNGCIITDVLDVMRARGLRFGGREHKIGGYVVCDPHNPTLVKAAIALFGAVTFGINLPADWLNRSTWDVSNSRVVGGHDVTGVKYDSRGVFVSSWGRLYLMTWGAIAQRGRIDECYALLSPDWTSIDGLSPAGIDVAGLTRAMDSIGGGDVPDPKPPTPPKPPAPTRYAITASMDDDGNITGTAEPLELEQHQGAEQLGGAEGKHHFDEDYEVFECRRGHVAMALSALLWPIQGVRTQTHGGKIEIHRDGLTPEQWQQLMAFILQMIQALGPLFKMESSEGSSTAENEGDPGASGVTGEQRQDRDSAAGQHLKREGGRGETVGEDDVATDH